MSSSTKDTIPSAAEGLCPDLTSNQERLLYLLSLYSETTLSTPHLLVLVFEDSKDPKNESDPTSTEIDVELDENVFTYEYFESFADIQPGLQIQLYSSMILKNDLRFFKKNLLVSEVKKDVETGNEICYQITGESR